jgi:hypothetical protein
MAGEVVLVEPLNGGLVTARDPATLRPGELQRCDNTIYRPNDQAIFKAPGRDEYNSTAFGAIPVKGVRALSFDGLVDPWLIAHHGTSYAKSKMDDEDETAFTSLGTTFGDGDSLDSIHYDNKHYLFNGEIADDATTLEGRNHCIKEDVPNTNLIIRRHGLAPVVSFPAPTRLTFATQSWPDDTTFPLGWYFFLLTEVHDAGGPDELESAFEGTPQGINIELNTHYVRITLPATLVNDGSEVSSVGSTALINKIRVYMSTMQPTTGGQPPTPSLDAFFQIAEVPWVASSTVDLSSAGTAVGYNMGLTPTLISGWNDLGNAVQDNNIGAETTTINATMAVYNFGFSGITGTISGIEVEVKYRENITGFFNAPAQPGLAVGLTKTANTSNTLIGSYQTAAMPAFGWHIELFGGPNNTLSGTWAPSDINGITAFGVLLKQTVGGHTLQVDYVKVKVYTGVLHPGKPYPVVAIIVGDVIITESANSEPPCADTGDIFESQMVLNDVSKRAVARYSLPDSVEYFPKDYYIQFSSKEQDRVTCIRRLGNKLIVGLRYQLFRVNYLPRQLDAEFDRGRAVEAISESHGIVGTQAAALREHAGDPCDRWLPDEHAFGGSRLAVHGGAGVSPPVPLGELPQALQPGAVLHASGGDDEHEGVVVQLPPVAFEGRREAPRERT